MRRCCLLTFSQLTYLTGISYEVFCLRGQVCHVTSTSTNVPATRAKDSAATARISSTDIGATAVPDSRVRTAPFQIRKRAVPCTVMRTVECAAGIQMAATRASVFRVGRASAATRQRTIVMMAMATCVKTEELASIWDTASDAYVK